MITRLSGNIVHKTPYFIVLEVGGVGYKIHVSQSLIQELKENKSYSLWTHLAIKETSMELYGFKEKQELDFFQLLIDVSGIGPKSALGILNLAPTEELTRAIQAEDTAYLTKVSGIGRKIAGKIVLDLKDKLGSVEKGAQGTSLREEVEALEALKALGYRGKDAREALRALDPTIQGPQDRIKEALKILSQ